MHGSNDLDSNLFLVAFSNILPFEHELALSRPLFKVLLPSLQALRSSPKQLNCLLKFAFLRIPARLPECRGFIRDLPTPTIPGEN